MSSNVRQHQQRQQQQQRTTPDRPEKISFYLKTSIFTRRVTIDWDELALGSIKQLAIAFMNEVYFQHSYPQQTYIGDYIREHYSNRDNLSHLYERLILEKYSNADDCFVPFNSVSDIEPESYISIEVCERAPRHLLNNNNNNNNISNNNAKQTTGNNHHDSPFSPTTHTTKQYLPPVQQQRNLSNSPSGGGGSTTTTTSSSCSSTGGNYQNVGSLSSSSFAVAAIGPANHLIRMTHDFKQESYFRFTYCASCSHLIKGIILQGYQCKNCKKNFCDDCKARAEMPGSSDSCIVPVDNSQAAAAGSDSHQVGGGQSPISNLFSSSSKNQNSIDSSATTTATNNPSTATAAAAGSSTGKLEVGGAHTNMSKRKSASNLLQHLNLANSFKTHHNNQNQPQTPKEDKTKSMGESAGALEPVLQQLTRQREQQQQQQQQQHYYHLPQPSNESSNTSSSGNTLLVTQTTQLSSSHQNLFMNGTTNEANPKRMSESAQAGGDGAEGGGSLQRLSNSARTSANDLLVVGTLTANRTSIKRDQANHSFTLMDLSTNQKSEAAAAAAKTTTTDDQQGRCDVCNKSLGSNQKQQHQQQQQPLVCKICKLHVHSHCRNLVLTDCMSRIAESSRAAAAAAASADTMASIDGGEGIEPIDDQAGGGDRVGLKSTNSNVSRGNIRLHRLAPSIKHVKRPDLTKPILEGWLEHTTLSDEQARKHYWRLDETDLTLYEDDMSTRYFKAIALSKITRVMSSHSLPKQIREDVLLTNALLSSTPSSTNKQQHQQSSQQQGPARSATTSPIKTPELQAQMKAMFAFELATGSMYLVQAQSELEASKWREFLANVTGKTNQPEDKQQKSPAQMAPQIQKHEEQQQQKQQQTKLGAVDKLVDSVNRIDLEQDKIADSAAAAQAPALVLVLSQPAAPPVLQQQLQLQLQDKTPPRQPAVQRQHHHRYPPSGHRRANSTDPNRSRLYNKPRKEIALNRMDIPDHLIEAKYLVEKDHAKGGFVELGSGQFGKVYAAISEYKPMDVDKSIWSGVPVAIKEISKARFDLRQQAKLKNEANILSGLNHPGVIILERVHDLPDKIYIVMEQLEDDMLEMIVSTREKRLNERVTKFLTYQILEALKYLHSQKIAHCDLKPENVLLVDKHTYPQIKLCDFGFAKIIEENSFRSSLVGTPAYLAPEVVKGERYNRSVDLWSVGVIVYVSLSGEFPFNEGENIHDQISRANFMYPKEIWKNISQQAMDFINSLLRVNCEKRLSASTAQMDVWIQDFQLWCDLCDLELRVGKRWVTDDADYDQWSRYAKENGRRIPSSAVHLHMDLNYD